MLEIMRLVLSKLLMDMSINFITVKLISPFTRILARYRTFVQTMVTWGGKQFKIFDACMKYECSINFQP